MKTKTMRGLKVEDDAKGEVSAVFATLNVVDHDGDVTLPGAFTDGEKVRISAYNHKSWDDALPVGRGVIHEDGDEAIFEGAFFMDTTAGADTFATVKAMSDLQEWSYGYDILKASFGKHGDDDQEVQFLEGLKVHEISPVILGAGLGTRTLAAKGKDMKLIDHAGAVLTDLDELIARAANVMTLREGNGKSLGEESMDLLSKAEASLERLVDLLKARPADENAEALVREVARYERTRITNR